MITAIKSKMIRWTAKILIRLLWTFVVWPSIKKWEKIKNKDWSEKKLHKDFDYLAHAIEPLVEHVAKVERLKDMYEQAKGTANLIWRYQKGN